MSGSELVNKIKYLKLPACINCIFFKKYSGLHNSLLNLEQKSECKKFGTKNLISGEITYELATHCRSLKIMCGMMGTYFIRSKQFK